MALRAISSHARLMSFILCAGSEHEFNFHVFNGCFIVFPSVFFLDFEIFEVRLEKSFKTLISYEFRFEQSIWVLEKIVSIKKPIGKH